ncbi:MAG: FAD-dependent oxidoreductase, partial [Candidatus Marsarchaeota archaeon]|nr:FAD-dependent oxidoreductase [Candidatus Marsarchaeota archaeon]
VYYIHLNGGDDSWYEIPYRAIVVKGITNLFAIGRCISSEFEAQASVRVTGTAMSMGQAAAFASMLTIKNNIPAKEVNIKELQALLKAYGAII